MNYPLRRRAAVLLHADGIGYADIGRLLGISRQLARNVVLEEAGKLAVKSPTQGLTRLVFDQSALKDLDLEKLGRSINLKMRERMGLA